MFFLQTGHQFDINQIKARLSECKLLVVPGLGAGSDDDGGGDREGRHGRPCDDVQEGREERHVLEYPLLEPPSAQYDLTVP